MKIYFVQDIMLKDLWAKALDVFFVPLEDTFASALAAGIKIKSMFFLRFQRAIASRAKHRKVSVVDSRFS